MGTVHKQSVYMFLNRIFKKAKIMLTKMFFYVNVYAIIILFNNESEGVMP